MTDVPLLFNNAFFLESRAPLLLHVLLATRMTVKKYGAESDSSGTLSSVLESATFFYEIAIQSARPVVG